MIQNKEPYSPPACGIRVLLYVGTLMTCSSPDSTIGNAVEDDWGLLAEIPDSNEGETLV